MVREITTCTRRLEFDAAHRVPGHGGKCRTLHGHRYAVEVTCMGEVKADGMIVDFGVIKSKLGAWIDEHLDHTTLLWRGDPIYDQITEAFQTGSMPSPLFMCDDPPTAEFLARLIFWRGVQFLAGEGCHVKHVRVYETPNCWADYTEEEVRP